MKAILLSYVIQELSTMGRVGAKREATYSQLLAVLDAINGTTTKLIPTPSGYFTFTEQ